MAFTQIISGIIAAAAFTFAKFSSVFFSAFSTDNHRVDHGFVNVSAVQVPAVGSIVLLPWFTVR